MASVKLSMGIRDSIRETALKAFDAANPEPKLTLELVDEALTLVRNDPAYIKFDELMTWMEDRGDHELGSFYGKHDFYRPRQNLESVELVTDVEVPAEGGGKVQRMAATLDLKAKGHVRSIRTSTHGWWGARASYQLDKMRGADADNFRGRVHAMFIAAQGIRDKRSQYLISINQLLSSVNSVKQLLDVWPAAENLLPQDVLEKHHSKAERKQKSAADIPQFDTMAADMIVMKAKLRGAV